ncbi:MAG TPA: GNAT family N-acetyltransferase [Pyrinomonadaceae bacterium]|nr:GNAT family N-acetyltransferase [Pyrinomonadaceae bacterium]
MRCRKINVQDLDALTLLVSDPDVMKYLGVEAGTLMTRDETEVALAGMIEFWAEHGFGRWAVLDKAHGRLIGLCGFRLLEDTPELFYLFDKVSWGKGLATEAATACLRFAFEELGFQRIVAVTRHSHTASIRVMTKIGMRYEKEVMHSGVNAVCYVATPSEYQPGDAPYKLGRE